jgi:hypothetical protein
MSLPLSDKHSATLDPRLLGYTRERSTFNVQRSTHPTTLPERATRNAQRATLSTGIDELDQLLKGGVPRGKILEIVGSNSSGKTSLVLSILAQSTSRGEITAYVDVVDSLDPKYAQAVGIDLKNFLWVRCAKEKTNRLEPLGRALKAADILCQAGGFGVITIDLADLKVPSNTWFRLQRVIRGSSTVFAVISSQKTTGSASSLVLSLERHRSFWTSDKRSQFVRKPYFHGIESEACLLRGKSHGSVTVHCRF